MSYQYDVFFSYKRDAESDSWHLKVKDKLQYWLKQELNRTDVSVFFDTEDIRTGLRWRNKLATALLSSKTIVCIWSPLYFQSRWCVSEWKTFESREKLLSQELIVPARYHDGEFFPRAAKDVQSMDFSDYTSTASRFWDTEIAVDFENSCIKPFATDLAHLIQRAPAFQSDFPLVEVQPAQLQSEPAIGRIANA